MILDFRGDSVSAYIKGCPGDVYRVTVTRDKYNAYINYFNESHSNVGTLSIAIIHYETIKMIINNKLVPDTLMIEVGAMLGFIPVCDNINGKLVYNKALDYTSMDELTGRRKPTVMTTFLGVQMPVAIVNEMEVMKSMDDMQLDDDKFTEPDALDYLLPPDILPYVRETLESLSDYSHEPFSVEGAKVCNYLGLMHLFNGKSYIIHGDQLLEHTLQNALRSGHVSLENMCFTLDNIGMYNGHIPDGVIEVSDEYRRVREYYIQNNNPGTIAAMKLIIKQYGNSK